jgi:2-polyprenyl-3-methyl-5-hydroxy-6-metoxy-1,4-benzoquinol methylase
LDYWHFNTEEDDFPFDDQSFDVVLFCEIIEHLLMDPVRVLLQIKRVLKPGGQLILSTPNVSRLENVARMLSGSNIYDPYSGYGPYGRHNREYNKHELDLLLRHAGYRVEHMFSADVHENRVNSVFDIDRFLHLVKFREHDLGQYIFVRAVSRGGGSGKKPNWLYRSYPSSELGE